MKPGTALPAAFFSTVVLAMTATLSAFAEEDVLVIVDIKTIAAEIARNADVEASEIPLTVRAPVEVAAKACGISPDVLRSQGGQGGVSCEATKTSPALERLIEARRRQQ